VPGEPVRIQVTYSGTHSVSILAERQIQSPTDWSGSSHGINLIIKPAMWMIQSNQLRQ